MSEAKAPERGGEIHRPAAGDDDINRLIEKRSDGQTGRELANAEATRERTQRDRKERERRAALDDLFYTMLDQIAPGYRFRASQARMEELRHIAGLDSRPHLEVVDDDEGVGGGTS